MNSSIEEEQNHIQDALEEDFEQPKIDKKMMTNQYILCEIFHLVWGIFFFLESKKNSKQSNNNIKGTDTCRHLSNSGLFFSIYCFSFVMIRMQSLISISNLRLFVVPFLVVDNRKYLTSRQQLCLTIADYSESIIGILFVVLLTVSASHFILIFMKIVYQLQEPCKELRTLTFLFLLIVYILIFLLLSCWVLIYILQAKTIQR